MNAEQAKKSADAIILAFARIGTDWQTAARATEEIVKILTAQAPAPVEREYRAGEWMPKYGEQFFAILNYGNIYRSIYGRESNGENYAIKTASAFPSKAIAEAAKAHADWWREFDKIADEQAQLYRDWGSVDFSRGTMWQSIYIKYAPPKVELSLPFIERLGGEQKVAEMLNKGRVFRFKWGGQ